MSRVKQSYSPCKNINHFEHDKTNITICESTEGSDQPAHPRSLIRDFAVRLKKFWVLGYPVNARNCPDVQADLSLR